VVVRLNARRVEQLSPATAPARRVSTFQTGIQFNINAKGPGSFNGTDSLSFARVTGPGLPAAGLVYIAPAQAGQQSMDLSNKTGTVPATGRCGGPSFNCPNFWLARTNGIAGTDATTLAVNFPGLVFAQPSDNADASKLVKRARYKIELFYGPSATAGPVFHKSLISDLVAATNMVNMPWNTLGDKSKLAMDPNGSLAGAQSGMLVDWVQNPSAQQIGSVQMNIDYNDSYGPSQPVARGATSVEWTTPVPALAGKQRTILLGYRMLDNTNKTSVFFYN